MQDDVLEAAPAGGVRFEHDTEVAQLVEVLASVYYRLDTDIDQLRRDRYTGSATGRELDRHGREVSVSRPTDEDDPAFRRRVQAGRGQATSQTTWDDFAQLCLDVLGADPEQVRLSMGDGSELGAVIVEITTTVLDDAPFSETEIVGFLEGALPMSRRVVLRPTDVATWGDAEKGWGTQWGGDIS